MGQVQLNKANLTLNTTSTSKNTEKKLSDGSGSMSAFQVIANNPPKSQKGAVPSGGGMDGVLAEAFKTDSQSGSMTGSAEYKEKLDDAKTQLNEFIKIYKESMANQRDELEGKSLLSNLGGGVGQSLEGTYDGAKGTAKEAYELFTLLKDGIKNGGDFTQFNEKIAEYADGAKEAYDSLINAAEIAKFIIENPELQKMMMEGVKDIAGDINTDQMAVMAGELIGDMIISAATFGAGKAVKAAGKGKAAKKLLDSLNQLVEGSINKPLYRKRGGKIEKVQRTSNEVVSQAKNTTWNPKNYTIGAFKKLPDFDGSDTLGILDIDGKKYYVKNGKGEPGIALKDDPTIRAGAIAPFHAEGHAISIIRKTGVKNAVLDINHPEGPCGYCEKVIRNMLPKDVELTINWPNGSFTYKGNNK